MGQLAKLINTTTWANWPSAKPAYVSRTQHISEQSRAHSILGEMKMCTVVRALMAQGKWLKPSLLKDVKGLILFLVLDPWCATQGKAKEGLAITSTQIVSPSIFSTAFRHRQTNPSSKCGERKTRLQKQSCRQACIGRDDSRMEMEIS